MFDIFSYEFMRRAFIAGAIIAVIAPLVGNFLVLRRLSQMGHALSHVALAGVAAGILAGIDPTIGSIAIVLLAAFGIEELRKTYFQYSELSIAIIVSAGMAVAIILLNFARGGAVNVMNYLFGSIVSVTYTDVVLISTLGLLVILAIALFYKELLYITFDEEAATISGLPVSAINFLFTILVALTVALAMRIVGALLVSSLMVTPSAASLKIAQSFKQAIIYSIIFSFISVFAGIILSFYFDLSPGGTIILISLAIMGITSLKK
ncbi:MAG: zinc transport system permease protein [Caldanaerobacter sp.]|jgi:zinc transport system permease protein|uniref:metal ABC transporter permease n=1 Tax=Caldanaerobacter sp. TaxID=2930036 RepID=UPI0024AA8B53|nr:metal ABC transporter permease [Caldanaerobacter sp.]MDI3519184.1 zinc transport system permease protein [Caldanaerobacter sp.]